MVAQATQDPATDQPLSSFLNNGPALELIYPRAIFPGQIDRIYSDLFSIAIGERLYPPHDIYLSRLSDPRKVSTVYGSQCSLTVRKTTTSHELYGPGWGFEIVRWHGDTDAGDADAAKMCRIGRMNSESDAYKAGLRPNDIVLSINGRPVNEFRSSGELAASILGLAYNASWQLYLDVMVGLVRREILSPAGTGMVLLVRQPNQLTLQQQASRPQPATSAIQSAAPRRSRHDVIDLTEDDERGDNSSHNLGGRVAPKSPPLIENPAPRYNEANAILAIQEVAHQLRDLPKGNRQLCSDDLGFDKFNQFSLLTMVEVRIL
jgi:hypothetical protein